MQERLRHAVNEDRSLQEELLETKTAVFIPGRADFAVFTLTQVQLMDPKVQFFWCLVVSLESTRGNDLGQMSLVKEAG